MSAHGKPASAGRVLILVLAVATLLTLLVRLRGIDYLIPQNADPLRYAVTQAEYLWAGGDPKSAPKVFHWYPSLVAQAIALTAAPVADGLPADLARQLYESGESIVRVRVWVVVLSVLAVPGTWLLARGFLGPGASLLASLFMATSFLHSMYSTQARLHSVQASMGLLALVAFLRLRKNPATSAYLLAGILATLAVCTLHNGVFVVPALLAAHVLRERPRRSDWAKLAIPAAIAVPAVLWFYPFMLKEEGTTAKADDYTGWGMEGGDIEMGPQRVWIDQFNGAGFGRLRRALWEYDPALFVLLGAAVLILLLGLLADRRRFVEGWRGKDLMVISAHALPYLLVTGLYKTTFARFLLPLMPYVACLAAYAVERVARGAARATGAPAALVFGAASALALALPAYVQRHVAELHRAPDTYEQAANWLMENVDPEDGRILVPPYFALPMFYSKEALARALAFPGARHGAPAGSIWLLHQEQLPWTDARRELAYELWTIPYRPRRLVQHPDYEVARNYLEKTRVRYAVLVIHEHGTQTLPPLGQMDRAIRTEGALVARFKPRDDIGLWGPPFDYQEAPKMLRRHLESDALGPWIEIYDLAPP